VNVQLDTVSATRKNLIVALDANEVEAEHKSVVAEVTKLARIPGFRPGKVPAAMIIRRFGKEIAAELKQKVVARAYQDAIKQEKVDVLNVVKVEEGEVAPGMAAEIKFLVDVRPDFVLPEYRNLPTEVLPLEATEAEVERVIEGLRAERADFKTAERGARKGDFVKLAYEGTLEGKPIAKVVPEKALYGKVPQTWEEVEGTTEGVIPGLGRQLGGLKAGDRKALSIAFPPGFAAVPALAGRTASYTVEVLEVRERVLPALEAEFFKAQNVEDLAGLQKQVRANLRMQREYQNRAAQRRQVTEWLGTAVDFPVPDSLVEAETQGVLRQIVEEQVRRGVPEAELEKSKRELFETARRSAHNRVKIQLILAKIAEKENLEVNNDDLNNFVYREAMRAREKPERLARDLANDRNQARAAQQAIIFDKAVDFLVAHARVTTVQPRG
jgi:trigger factor